jgi:hypothetical protein
METKTVNGKCWWNTGVERMGKEESFSFAVRTGLEPVTETQYVGLKPLHPNTNFFKIQKTYD